MTETLRSDSTTTVGAAFFVCRGSVEALPPALFAVEQLRRYFSRVVLIASDCSTQAAEFLRSRGIELRLVHEKHGLNCNWPGKALGAVKFHRLAWQVMTADGAPQFIWVVNAHTAIVLGRRLLNHVFVLQLMELDEAAWLRRALLHIVPRAAAVVVPEHCRAAIVRSWYGLPTTPHVLPNKSPVIGSRARNLPISDSSARVAIDSIGAHAKIVLYQGIIRADRDIRPAAELLNHLGAPWRLVVMGTDFGFLRELKKACPDLVYIPNVGAPLHLEITSHAHIGLACYAFDCLNNIFCAPNKVFEYAAFGVPVLANDVPSLQLMVAGSGGGLCCDFGSREEVARHLKTLDTNYGRYSSSAQAFYDTTNCEQRFSSIVSKAITPYELVSPASPLNDCWT